MAANGISTLDTKELRQIAKLDLAAEKRGETYDIDLLPTKYVGNSVVNNPNVGGLQPRRPWTGTGGGSGLTPYGLRTNYPFDFVTPPTTGTVWNDDVNQVSIAINGTAARTSSYGRGIVFNGTNTFLEINNITSSISALTISMAADFQSAGGNWNPIYHGGSYGGNDIFAYMSGGNTDSMSVGTGQTFDPPVPIVNNGLAWWDFVYSGTSVKVYKNGVEVIDGTLTEANIGFTSPLKIGVRYDSGTDFLNGTIYRIKGVMSALTPGQIITQYNSITSTYGLPPITTTLGPYNSAFEGGGPGTVYFLISTYPDITTVPIGAQMTGTIFANPASPVTITNSAVWVNPLYWFVNYSVIPPGTANTTTADTFTITW